MSAANEQERTGAEQAGWAEPVGLLRSVVVGALVGVVVAFVGTTVGILLAGQEAGSAVGLGLFIAVWGGLGFGSMVGGVTWVSKHEEGFGHTEGDHVLTD
jgi:hypothetical protein